MKRATIFEGEIINNKAFDFASLIFTEPWALANEIVLNIMQNFKSDFLDNCMYLTLLFHEIFFNV